MLHSKKAWLIGTVIVACVCISIAPASAQQAKTEPKADAKKEPAKPRGRLPAYYAQVVTPLQREQIYSLQKPIMEKIDALEAQIAELRAQLEKESRAILTPEQLKKIEELQAATQEKIKAARTADGAPAAKPAEALEKAPAAAPAKPAATKK